MNKPINLRTLLATTLSGASFIGVDIDTELKLNVKYVNEHGERVPNPYCGQVRKLTTYQAQIFQNQTKSAYESMVQRRLVAEGKDPANFELQPRKWGTRLPNLPIIQHGDQFYLEFIFHKKISSQYIFKGKVIDKSEIVGWPATSKGEQGGLEDKVEIRSVKLSNIVELRVGGEKISNLYFE